jgi:hypothetical protein
MNLRSRKLRLHCMLLGVLMLSTGAVAATFAYAGTFTRTINEGEQSQGGDHGIIFKTPKGYMPLDFPEIKGVLMITQKKPSGMFIVYPSNGQSIDEISNKVRATIKGMFVHGGKTEPQWSVASLEPHQGISDETGTLALGTGPEQDIQIATYTRAIGEYKYLYGYFALRNKTDKSKEQNGEFLDSTGKGVKEFDEFWRSIGKRK